VSGHIPERGRVQPRWAFGHFSGHGSSRPRKMRTTAIAHHLGPVRNSETTAAKRYSSVRCLTPVLNYLWSDACAIPGPLHFVRVHWHKEHTWISAVCKASSNLQNVAWSQSSIVDGCMCSGNLRAEQGLPPRAGSEMLRSIDEPASIRGSISQSAASPLLSAKAAIVEEGLQNRSQEMPGVRSWSVGFSPRCWIVPICWQQAHGRRPPI